MAQQSIKSQQASEPMREDRRRGGEQPDANDLIFYLKKFANDNPTSAAMWCLGIGFILGWRLKPW